LNSAARGGSPYSFIRRVNAGVIFLGTPFKGTAAHAKAQWLTTYSRLKGERTSLALIRDLENSTGVLDDLVREFALSSRTEDYYLPIYCFFETEPTNLSKKVLPKLYAELLKVKEFVRYTNVQDHLSILNFRSWSTEIPLAFFQPIAILWTELMS
jgi:hypothetical protein